MWIKDKRGVLYNLNQAYKIEVGTSAGVSKVYATFSHSGNKPNDPAFFEIATLATFDNQDDAKAFLDKFATDINGVI